VVLQQQVPIVSALSCRQGATFSTAKYFPVDASGLPLNMTGATAHMQARTSASASAAAIDITNGSTGIVLDTTDNSYRYLIPHATTDAVASATYVFDTFVLLASGVRVLVEIGSIRIDAAITSDP
jgi:hypothetical protein